MSQNRYLTIAPKSRNNLGEESNGEWIGVSVDGDVMAIYVYSTQKTYHYSIRAANLPSDLEDIRSYGVFINQYVNRPDNIEDELYQILV